MTPDEHFRARRCAKAGCRAWPAHGYDVALLRGRVGRWYCTAHKPGDAVPPPVSAPPKPSTQGVLGL